MSVEYQKHKFKKRRSCLKNLFQPSITSSKYHQVCFPSKSKSFQEVKSQSIHQNDIKYKKKYETSEDNVKSVKPHSVDIDSYLKQILLNFNGNNFKVSTTSLSSSTSHRFDLRPNISNKYPFGRFGRNLEYHINQLAKHTFNPVSSENLYSNLNMAEELKMNEQDENIDLDSTNQKKREENEENETNKYADLNRLEENVNDEESDEKDEEITMRTLSNQSEEIEHDEAQKNENGDKEEEENEEVGEEEEEKEDVISREEISGLKSESAITLGFETDEKVRESMIMDSTITKEISEANKKCAAFQKEIKELQEEVKILQNKEDLTDSDQVILDKKHFDLMEKIKALDSLTKKYQERFGLDTFPSNHGFIQKSVEPVSESRLEEKETVKSKVDRWKAWEAVDEEDLFEFSQQSYPEDKLPRLIVCGHTEDRIPKIVVADSQKKLSKNIRYLEDIAGELSDVLNMQEKLPNENSQLENGKYKLQKALLAKYSVVESLQQKVCSLQAEMRMIVKENEKLSHQITHLNKQIGYQICPTDCSGSPPRFSPRLQHNPDYYNFTCASKKQQKYKNDHQRLSGGGSGKNICCLSQLFPNQKQKQFMSSRGSALIPVSAIESLSTHHNCPAEIEDKLMNYESNTKQLEQQLAMMETEVRNMKLELENTQKERQQLKQQSKLLKCTGPCAPCPCPSSENIQNSLALAQVILPSFALGDSSRINKPISGTIPSYTGVCTNAPMGVSDCHLQQLRDLREQYARLQEDYKNKLKEVSYLRTNADKIKQDIREAKNAKEKAENQLIDLQERLKIFESEKNKFNDSKEQIMEQEQTLIVMKQGYREAQDELEELRALIQDQANQIEDYRNKYLQAQEQVEEQKRQLDLIEMDNARMNENVTLEIGRVKNQFQEKLAELAPLPDILKQTQIKLQESQQMRLLAERNCEELTRELLSCRDKIGTMTSQSEILKNENVFLKGSNPDQLDDLENKNRELNNENERLKNTLARFEEREAENKGRLDEKMHEIIQLTSMLEQVREDSARQVARTKERCETVRKSMQAQINEVEKQLVQCRATAKAAQRDRDEIRQKMQGQINHLNEAFDLAQGRIRTLQGHVNYLKTSYSNIFNPGKNGEDQINTLPQSLPLETNIL